MNYHELLHLRDELNDSIQSLQTQLYDVEKKIEKANDQRAEQLFEGILDSLREMATLGHTIIVETSDGEWHELGISLRDISMTTTDYQEAIFEIIGEKPSSSL